MAGDRPIGLLGGSVNGRRIKLVRGYRREAGHHLAFSLFLSLRDEYGNLGDTGGVRTPGMEMGLLPKQASIYMAFTMLRGAKERASAAHVC